MNIQPISHQGSSRNPYPEINSEAGIKKINNDANQFKSMLVTFDRLTVDQQILLIYESLAYHKKKEAIWSLR